MNRVMNIIDTLKYRARRVFKSKTAVTAVALSFAFIGVVFASVIVPLMSEMPSDNPWDYAMVTFGDGESLICSSYTMSVYGDIRSNGGIQLSGRGMYVSGMAVARGNITSTTALGDKRENSGQIVHNDVFNNIHTLAGGKTTHSNKVIYSMQNDPNIDSIRNNISIPFLRTAGSSDTGFAVNPDTRAVTVTNRGGTSQGIQVIAADINAVVKSNHSYRIEFSGNFPNNPTATARIRVENPTGATLATADAVNGRFTLSAVLTAEQILSDAQAGIRYSLG
ncbi:MAG: hypothetical protein FWG45_04380, partial [Oscillospiraceae bacterium]|nr:hypothetical protein [Oscillospiraceae bacterium]